MSDTTTMLGKLCPPEARRDAVHVAVVPVVASELLEPGTPVSITASGQAIINRRQPVGIVDPFLTKLVEEGQRFWLFLKPGTTTGLRHVWDHPAFPPEGEQPAIEAAAMQKAVSKAWMEAWCAEKQADVDSFLAAVPTGEYCFGDTDYPHTWEDFPEAFWIHYKVLTGRSEPAAYPHFRCAC